MANNDLDSIEAHRKLKGKLRVELADELNTPEKLSLYYTPGVGAVSRHIAENPESARELTGINNTVAVISDGSAVLGLGNIGPHAALPVMEGKAMLFKQFADINSIPIVLNVHSSEEIIATAAAIAPSFGGINLEDIAAPICFEVEDKLKEILDIPVFHDDQHGTAIVVLAGLINAAKVVNKELEKLKIVVIGAGAAGHAVSMLLVKKGIKNVLVLDRSGVISKSQKNLRSDKQKLADATNPEAIEGNLQSALVGADVVIGVSGPGLLTADHIKTMNTSAIVMALSNPAPEIMPEEALRAGAKVVATGRSDFANQINNALVFPAIFRGALDNRVKTIIDNHKLKAAEALAALVETPDSTSIVPKIGDPRILDAISSVIK